MVYIILLLVVVYLFIPKTKPYHNYEEIHKLADQAELNKRNAIKEEKQRKYINKLKEEQRKRSFYLFGNECKQFILVDKLPMNRTVLLFDRSDRYFFEENEVQYARSLCFNTQEKYFKDYNYDGMKLLNDIYKNLHTFLPLKDLHNVS